MSQRILICGSREWHDMSTIYRRVEQFSRDTIVIHGGAKGADQIAGQAAKAHGLHQAVVYPMWDLYGNSAGHKRNAAMLALEPSLVIAFSLGTNGTQGTIDRARKLGIPVEVIGSEVQPSKPRGGSRERSHLRNLPRKEA